MRGYDSQSYGDAFADVYDEWYSDVTDVGATVDLMHRLVGDGGSVIELGVGTGRLALPMAAAGLHVVGIDSSQTMLDHLARRSNESNAQPMSGSVDAIRGDMARDLPDGPFDACLVAYNTILNLLDADQQQACFREVSARLAPRGHFVVEAIVPDSDAPAGTDVSVRSMSVDRVVLSISDHRPEQQRTEGQFVELTEGGGVRLRPWAIRLTTPAELDAMAAPAGLELVERWANMAEREYTGASTQHVSVYRRT